MIPGDDFVWTLTMNEVEEAYKTTQLNNYVYAGLKLIGEGMPPSGRRLELIEKNVPPSIVPAARDLLALAPHIGKDDAHQVRVHYVYRAFKLFRSFSALYPRDTESVMELLASLAFIPILAEKNDDFPLWYHPLPRPMNDLLLNAYQLLRDDCDITQESGLRWENKGDEPDWFEKSPMHVIFGLVPRIVQALIICDENGIDREGLETAWHNLEKQTRNFEEKNGLIERLPDRIRLSNPGMIRYRNTMYLYGGEFFRRLNKKRTAIEWFRNDIVYPTLSEDFVFFLTDMKTSERLLAASNINSDQREQLQPLLKKANTKILSQTAKYAMDVLDAVARSPGIDLGSPRIQDENRPWLYAGEASRELFLYALLYRWMSLGKDLAFPDYRRFFRYV